MILFVFGLGLLYFAEWTALYGGLRVHPGAAVFDITLMVVSLFLLAISRSESPTTALIKGILGLINGVGLILVSIYTVYERILIGHFDIINALLSPLNVAIGLYLIFVSLREVGGFNRNGALIEEY